MEKHDNVFTYNDGMKFKGDGYSLDIPDGFKIKEYSNGDIAYLPKENGFDGALIPNL